jgi:pilus assembly protein CpaB
VATLSVYRLLRDAAEPRREPTRTVVLVSRDVPAGVPVPREALSQVSWPERVAPPEAFASPDSVAGRVTRVALSRGEPVRTTSLAPRGAAPGLEGTITPDHRAIAVRVNEAAGVSGLVRPDSRVDVLVTSRGDNVGTTARLVMADVRVLGVGPARPPEPKEGEAKDPLPANVASIVTLEVTPAQAALVAAAEQQGIVQVVLRGFGSRPGTPDAGDATAFVPSVAALAPVAPAARLTPPNAGAWAARRGAAVRYRAAGAGTFAATSRSADAAVGPPAGTAVAPPPAARPESVTVQIYRGGQLTTLRVPASAPVAAGPVLRTATLSAP